MPRVDLWSTILLTLLLSLLCISDTPAQGDSLRYGTWKQRPNSSGRGPKVLMRIDEPAGDGFKVTYEGVDADGTRIAYSYTARYDGKEYQPSGVGMGFGFTSIAFKRIDDYTWEATLKRDGEIVATIRNTVSKDGKTMTQTSTPAGSQTSNQNVWEKQ